ncbi:MAG TPA: DUF3467 domain-containing protein [Thermoanaerobaculia bacterium]|nr:DUF3467 domain-containing protein [Thermoanaerobaculia bacterium]
MAKKRAQKKGPSAPQVQPRPEDIEQLLGGAKLMRSAGAPLRGTSDSPRFYSNRIMVTVTSNDFTFSFQQLGIDDNGNNTIQEVARVFVSALHVKAFRNLLSQQIEAYDRIFFALPETVVPKLPTPSDASEPEQPS